MDDLFVVSSPFFWLSVAFILFILEIIIVGTFFPVVFGVAALLTAVLTLFFDHWMVLFGLFIAFSFLCILFLKPLLEKLLRKDEMHLSNTDAIIGKVGFITKDIQPHKKGYIKIDHEEWAAASDTEHLFKEGERAVVTRIEGVTVFVDKEIKGNNTF